MRFFSTKELAEKWGIDQSRILRLAYAGRIEGATRVGNQWLFPSDAKKPSDGRTRNAKASKETAVFFRFPLYVNFSEEAYVPPLSPEELQLRRGQLAFHAWRMEEAKALLMPLADHAKNRYVRLAALYQCCYLARYENSLLYDKLLVTLHQELAKDFPYKKEMMLLRYGFDADSGFYKSLLEEFSIDPQYSYHPSAYDTLLLVSLIPIENGDFSLLSKLRFDTQELLCCQMEREGHFCEAQKLHFLLVIVYQLQNDTRKTSFHIRRGLELAMEHALYYEAVHYANFYQEQTKSVLRSFPPEFAKRIRALASQVAESQQRFAKTRRTPSFLELLSGSEYEYAFLANQGYTNREIAQKHKISEKTVSRIYNEIYEKLGVTTKQELVDLINNTHRNKDAE